jgi:catechol 2,3-dioxygenase-like lactoylglutathione lyase family enzyme
MTQIDLDHVVIAISDWERSRKFYADVLGAESIVFESGRRAFRVGSVQLNVHLPEDLPNENEWAPNLARIPVRPGGSDLCFRWQGTADEVARHLTRHQIEIELGPIKRPGALGDGTSVYFRDPDGSLLEFITYTD